MPHVGREPLKGALVGWQGSSGPGGSGATRISLVKYPENFQEGIWFGIQDYLRIYAGVGFPRIPVGAAIDRRDIRKPPMPRISKVVPISLGGPPKGIFREDPGRTLPQIKEVLPVPTVAAAPVLPRVRTSPSPTGGGLRNGDNMSDLTHFLRDVLPGSSDIFDYAATGIGAYNAWSGPSAPAAAPPAVIIPPSSPPGGGGASPPSIFDGGAAGCESDPRNNYVLKFSCGQWKWIKKQKRRRKRLASSSDINDLSKLKGVLGMGKAMETWIATHG